MSLVTTHHTYTRWVLGLCPCCGGELEPYEAEDGTVTNPGAIAEMVHACGRCIAMEHLSDERVPGLRLAMATAILKRDDTYIDALDAPAKAASCASLLPAGAPARGGYGLPSFHPS